MDAWDAFKIALQLAPRILGQTQEEPQQNVLSEKDVALINLRQKDGAVVVILGARGTGKSELAYRLVEFLDKPAFAVSPEQKPHPTFIQRINLDEIDERVPPGSTLLMDDLPVYASNRDYSDALVKNLERIIPMVRHERKLHLIFNSQSSAQADKYILDCDMAFFKPLGLLYNDFERPNIRRIYQKEVDQHFEGKSDDWIVRHAFMWSREYKGLIGVKKVS